MSVANTTIEERQWCEGILSKDAGFRLIVSGKIGAEEIERLIRFLRLQQQFIAGDEPASGAAASAFTQAKP